jgi:DNA-binding CsgD family transcriptional regulator
VSVESVVSDVERVAARGLQRDELHRELAARLRRAFPFDAACWHGLDPDTLLLTTANPEELHAHGFLTVETEPLAAQSVLSSEYVRADVNTFSQLAYRRAPVGILSDATRARPERSPRFVDFLSLRGTPYEMRAVFRARGRAWGCVVLHRTEQAGDFTAANARLLARLSRPIAEGIRSTLRVDAARREEDGGPGLIVLDAGDEPELVNRAAHALIELLPVNRGVRESVPFAVRTLAASARRSGKAEALNLPTPSGWVSLYASLPVGRSAGRVAIVLQRARTDRALQLSLETAGLTRREREVATLVIRGLSTTAISQRLFLSPWTVQDHLKAIFDKTSTRSRRELRALAFVEDCLPGMLTQAPLDADGHLVDRTDVERAPRSSRQ